MRRTFFILVGAIFAMTALAAPASAKGVISLTITGTGLDAPIVVAGDPTSDKWLQATKLSTAARMYPQAIPDASVPPSAERPERSGPRYVVTYTLDERGTTFVQHLYPYAVPQPVVFAPEGQRWIDGRESRSGWVQPTPELARLLRDLGVPPQETQTGQSTSFPVALGVLIVAASLAVAAAVVRRRKSHRRRPVLARPVQP